MLKSKMMDLKGAKLGALSEDVTDLGTLTTTGTINFKSGSYFKAVLGGNATITCSNMPAGRAQTVTLRLVNDATAGRTVIFSGAKFESGVAPTRTTAASAIDHWVLHWDGTDLCVALGRKDSR